VVNWPNVEPRTSRRITDSADKQRTQIKERLERIDQLFDVAEAYVAALDADPTLRKDLRFESMRPALAGEAPMFIWASSAAQIESAVSWAMRRGYRIVIVGGDSADEAIDTLRDNNVPVIVNGTLRLPDRRHDAYDRPYRLPAVLKEAGITFCIAPGSEEGMERNLNHHAGMAVQFRLSPDDAIRSITIDAARVLGIDDRYGSLEPGKSATLIVTDGDPLEITTHIMQAYIDGRKIDLNSRHTQLYEKYREKYRQRGVND
ncbi:MAG: amidohydrolase family protein, partial [Phycisphaerales bacterium]|nr:amidohydrolase family protein [Phycisphaerales bacterium]